LPALDTFKYKALSRFNFLIDLCVALVVLVRGDVLQNDFGENMKLLQVRF